MEEKMKWKVIDSYPKYRIIELCSGYMDVKITYLTNDSVKKKYPNVDLYAVHCEDLYGGCCGSTLKVAKTSSVSEVIKAVVDLLITEEIEPMLECLQNAKHCEIMEEKK